MKRIFVTGISTEVGKTIASAILTEALEADYWKPVQAGDLQASDSMRVQELLSNSRSRIFDNAYALKTPASPHAAAALEGITLQLSAISEPVTENHLVIEGAGGLLVPLNDTHTIADLILPHYKVVVVSRNYLGSINHTLLTLDYLKRLGHEAALIFNGEENPATEMIIAEKTGVQILGRIAREAVFDKACVRAYAQSWKQQLLVW